MDQFAQGQGPALKLIVTRLHHVPAHTEDAGPGVVGASELGKGVAPHLHNMFHVAEGFDVVDDRGTHVKAKHGREVRRLDPGISPFAFQGLNEAGLLPANVGPGPAMHINLKVIAAVEDVFAEETGRLGLGDCLFQHLPAGGELAADVEVGQLHPVGEAAEDHSLQQLVRILMDDLAVLEGAGLRFVRVADQIDRLRNLGGIDEAPLHPRGKTGAAASAQLALLHFLPDGVGPHREAFLQVLVAPVLAVARDVRRVAGRIHMLQDQAPFLGRHHALTCTPQPARLRAPHPPFHGNRRCRGSPAPFRRTPDTPRTPAKIFHPR